MRLAAATLLCGIAGAVVALPASFARPTGHEDVAGASNSQRTMPEAILVATPRRGERIVLRNRPAGRALAVLPRRTRFGSPVKLGVAVRRGNWLAVISEQLPNGRLGWVPRSHVSLLRISWSIDVSLSRHTMDVRRDGRLVRRMRVAIGAPSSPTPLGRYVITDHIDAVKYGNVYGCCILALSGHQPHPPSSFDRKTDWRLAIHGGGGLGSAVSAGCLHASDSDLRLLMRLTPLGTPVLVGA
ncbi:MAG: L,D-transpeptidase [Gaiellaceae bacterium]